jgi:hypothetical protein
MTFTAQWCPNRQINMEKLLHEKISEQKISSKAQTNANIF